MGLLFPTLFISAALLSAYGQDTRQVTEPKVPPSCTILTAGLASQGWTIAESDENKPDTIRIQQALDQCKPGQAVELKAGGGHDAFLSGPLQLRRGVTLLVDKGAILFGSRNPRDYDLAPGVCGTITPRSHACKPLIGGDHIADAAIMGDGIIDGRGGAKMLGQNLTWWQLADKGRPWALQNNPRMIILSACDNFILYRIQLRNSPNFHVSYSGGNGFTVWGVTIGTPSNAHNGDGIDIGQPWPEVPRNTSNVTITHCYIHAGDDIVAFKAPAGYLTSHGTVIHNHFYTGHGMSIGSATTGGVTAIRVSDLTIDGSDNGIRIKSNVKLGGWVHDVEYSDVCIRDSRNPLTVDPFYDSSGHEVDGADSNHPPRFSDIRLNNVLIQGGGNITLKGLDASHRLDISFHNFFLEPPGSFKIAAADADIRLDGSNMAVSGDDVKVSGAESKGTPAVCTGKFVPFPVPIGVK
ncbi:MAG: glycoside hydrolase family 28 protein [Bryobacteraceae bacterium]